jgi:glutaredoxin 2
MLQDESTDFILNDPPYVDIVKYVDKKLKEDIIKHHHNCKATGFWVNKSKEYNFLLLMHEYLFVFLK